MSAGAAGPAEPRGGGTGAAAPTGGGLSTARARALLAEAGPNAIPEHKVSLWARLAGKFWAPVPWMLEATVVLETALGKWLEAGIIGAVLVFNAGLGLVQEGRAQAALEALRARLAVTARARRDGAWQRVPAAELVPGDLVHVRVGDFVPADLRLTEGDVRVDQSVLTGESAAVARGPGDDAYSGSVVTRGEASGEVTATGPRSYYGRTAELVQHAGVRGHLDQVVLRMVRVFILVDLVLAAAGTAWLAAGRSAVSVVLEFAVVLLLASVPVALPAAFALAGALGAQRLAGRGILTARLTAIQDAATMDVLCADKTGTITQNRLAAGAVTARPGYTPAQVLGLAAEASDEATQDPIDLAVIAAARDRGAPRGRPRRDFVPFDPATKRSQATVAAGAGVAHVAKGAPQVIAALAGEPADPEVGRLAADGARVLAVAVSGRGGRWRQAGLIALADPPRPDAAALVTGLGALGVRVVMLTGDSLATAQAIAGQVGIFGPAIRAADVPEGGSELDFGAVAEVLPEDKHRIIRHLQQAGHTVGMTGDGVNDAPALRQAELGVAVAGATDVAKSAAGVVLTRPGLGGIAELVRESRRDHQRSLTYALNVAIKKIEIPFLLALGVFAWRQFIFTPLLMALMLLGNDVVSMTITTDRAGYAATPDTWDIRRFFTGALVLAVPLLALSAGVVWTAHAAWPAHSLPRLQTLVFLTLITSSQAALYLVRTRRPAWASRPGTWVIAGSLTDLAAAAALVLSGALMPAPLSPAVAAAVIGAVVAGVLLIDLIKVPVFGALGIHRT